MKIQVISLIILTTLILPGCLFDSGSDKIIADYETVWIDIPNTRGISKGETIVPAYVSEIGHNKDFIIAKQHPIKNGNITKVYMDTINFYIIEISSNSFQDKPVYGPLNKHSFDSLRGKLGITGIQFDMLYPEQ